MARYTVVVPPNNMPNDVIAKLREVDECAQAAMRAPSNEMLAMFSRVNADTNTDQNPKGHNPLAHEQSGTGARRLCVKLTADTVVRTREGRLSDPSALCIGSNVSVTVRKTEPTLDAASAFEAVEICIDQETSQ